MAVKENCMWTMCEKKESAQVGDTSFVLVQWRGWLSGTAAGGSVLLACVGLGCVCRSYVLGTDGLSGGPEIHVGRNKAVKSGHSCIRGDLHMYIYTRLHFQSPSILLSDGPALRAGLGLMLPLRSLGPCVEF